MAVTAATPVAIKTIPSQSVYRPELDMLRFFSFLAVFAVHTLNYPIDYLTSHHIPNSVASVFLAFVNGGGFGVDLFFLLSAYLITDLLLREKTRFGQLNVPAFYVRRALRIWPLYFAVISVVLLFPILDHPSRDFGAQFLFPFLLFSGNWSFVAWGWPVSVLVPLWSVSVEEQFYLLWPPIVSQLRRNGILIAAGVMIAIANIERFIEIIFWNHSPMLMWANTLAHLDSLAVGIGIAALLNGSLPKFNLVKRLFMAIAGICCLGIRGHFAIDANGPQGSVALFTYPVVVIGCALLLFAFLGLPYRSQFLQYLGKISYGLYVYHLVAINLVDRVYHGNGLSHAGLRLVLALALTIAISAVSYAILEKPFLHLKKRFTFVESRPA